MDLNVLSKLSPATDVNKGSGGPGPENGGFNTVFQDADKLSDSPQQESSNTKPGVVSDDNPEPLLAETSAIEPAQVQFKNPRTPKSPADVLGGEAADNTSGKTNSGLQSSQFEPKISPGADAPGADVLGLPATASNSNVAAAALSDSPNSQRAVDSASRIVTTTPAAQGSGIPPDTQTGQMRALPSNQSGEAGDIATGNAKLSPNLSGDPTNGVKNLAIDLRARNASPMTLVDRHLGGFPVTLATQGPQDALPGKGFQIGGWGEAGSSNATAPGFNATGLPAATGAQITPVAGGLGKTTSLEIFATLNAVRDVNAGTLDADLPQEAVWDPRPSAFSAISGANQAMPRADLAASVARQIADAMRNAGDKPVEIALNPVELGRVRMILNASDAGVTMNILADRPETLDLMRRNIDDLAKTFSELGYEDISFSFGHNDQAQEDTQQHHDNNGGQTAIHSPIPDTNATAEPSITRPAIAPNGIDMRL